MNAIAAIFLLLLTACSKKEEEAPEAAVPVQTVAAQKMPISRFIQAQAILYAHDQAAITPKISAPVSKFYVNRGDHVHKGQILAELESRDLAAAVTEAKANYDQAEANLQNTVSAALPGDLIKAESEVQGLKETLDAAKKVLESRKSLFQQGALPRKLLDESELAHSQALSNYEIAKKNLDSMLKVSQGAQTKSAQAQVAAAKGRLQAAEAQLHYTTILSPINGIVADRPLYEGETASAGTPLMTIVNIAGVIARANLPVNELQHIKIGDSAKIKAPDSSFEVSGRVTVVSPALNANSTTAEVWVETSNPEERLHPGATVQVSILTETIPDALVIPAAAILPSAEEFSDSVLVAGPDSIAHKRRVEIGIKEGDKVQILKGLTPGDLVVTTGGLGVQDGTKIQTENGPGEKSEQHDTSRSK